jgi:hypothetical protein
VFGYDGNLDGARLTPDEIAQQRKDAAALVQQGTDASPLPAGTRGAGVWTQGMARVAKALSGAFEGREADQAAKANADDNSTWRQQIIASLTPTATAAPAAAPAASNAALDPETTGYVNAAATKFGVDPAYLTRTALIESGGKADVVNPTSGAAGLYQFMPKTAKEYELTNPMDPEDSAMAAAELAKDNRDALKAALGRDPTNAELYLAHQQGAGGAAALLGNPNAPAVSVLGPNGRAAVLNNGGAENMTAGQFANMWLRKYGNDSAAPAPVQTATADPAAIPSNATPTEGTGPVMDASGNVIPVAPTVAKVAAAMPADAPASVTALPAAAPSPAVVKVSGALGGVNPGVVQALTSPYADEGTKKIAALVLQQQLAKAGKETYTQQTDKDGNIWNINSNGQKTIALKAGEDPTSVKEYQFYKSQLPADQQPMPYDVWSTAKARAAATNVTTNVDTNSGQTYDKQLAEGLGKSHAALANGVEDAQSRARDISAMQGAVDAIQKNGGTTGGMLPAQRLELQKSINAGAAALGLEKPFSEDDISDKEFLTKFNRSMAGAQAKNAVGSRVTNFEMSNFLKANPGLDMSVTGNQRLLGIQAQIEQRNIAVGNAIREATAQAISSGKKIDPVTVQRIITDYDTAHHIQDPTTGQDLTQSYALPEFQEGGTNAALADQHNANLGPTEKTIGGKTYVKQGDHWYEKP